MAEHVHNLKYLRRARKNLRKASTPQEKILWSRLRINVFEFKFRRQHGVGNFIVDFYCPAGKLAVELDGGQHLDNKEYDIERTNYFESLGIKVIRFWNDEIDKDICGVLQKIKAELKLVTLSPSLLS